MRKALVASVGIALALLAGCGSSEANTPAVVTESTDAGEPAPDETPGVPEACALVTPDEAAAALGKPVEAGVEQPGGLPGQKTCAYNAIDAPLITTISVVRGDEALWNQLKAASATAKDVTGVGDAAFRDAGQLYLRKGDLVVGVFISGMGSGPEVEAPLKSLAQAALTQL